MQSAAVSKSVAPQTTSSIVPHSHPTSSIATHLTELPSGPSTHIHHPRLSSITARESTKSSMASKRRESGTRLPYSTEDYASPPDTFSPNNSPPSSISSAMRPLSTTILGLPLYASLGLGILPGASYSTTSLSSPSYSGMDRSPSQVCFCLCRFEPHGQPNAHTTKRTRSIRISTPEIGCW